MASQNADADGSFWFFSDTNTDKVEAIRTNPHVNLAYANPGSQVYVSIAGRCELVRDHVKAKQLWNPQYRTWFPKELGDPNLILLKVSVQEAEYWNEAEGRMVQLPGFAGAGMAGQPSSST